MEEERNAEIANWVLKGTNHSVLLDNVQTKLDILKLAEDPPAYPTPVQMTIAS